MLSFSLETVIQEWQVEAQVLLEILPTLVSNPSQTRNICKNIEALFSRIVSVELKPLSIHYQELSLILHNY